VGVDIKFVVERLLGTAQTFQMHSSTNRTAFCNAIASAS